MYIYIYVRVTHPANSSKTTLNHVVQFADMLSISTKQLSILFVLFIALQNFILDACYAGVTHH